MSEVNKCSVCQKVFPIKSKEDIIRIKENYNSKINQYKYRVMICQGAGCVSSNSMSVKEALIKSLKENDLEDKVLVSETGCMGTCDVGPVMLVMPEGVFYTKLTPSAVPAIVTSHFINGKIKIDNTYFDKNKKEYVPYIKDIEFFKEQVKIALRNCGSIDFSSLEAYIANDGYMALAKVLGNMSPAEVVDEMIKSGLRGRGGGGFPTGIKWKAGLNAKGDKKYIVCNADEGDPGAFMDRSILEGDPHSVIEGMIIGGYAIGACKGYVYVRAEYPLAVERLEEAIQQSRKAGLLGENILGSGFDFDIEIRMGAGAFVCGEETALMQSIEGKRGEPKQKPPFPFEKGLFGMPTIINNVETLANISPIILNGAEWFMQFGTEKSRGTKVFALAGDINNTGLVEVPMGITVGDIIYKIGGGIPKQKEFKAAQTGGPSGGCLTKEHLNTKIDYDSLTSLGTIMGSGGLIIMDEDTCMVDMARFFMEFVQDESCGKCVPCRIGTKRMLEILERIVKGEGKEGDIELLEELASIIRDTAICGLGQTAPNPVLSTINNFREEYEEHIKNKHCVAGVCADLFLSPCQNACPAGINVPGYVALIAEKRPKDAYDLIMKDNPFPAICGRVCTHPCERKCRRGQLDEPIAIAELKRFAADYVMTHDEETTEKKPTAKNGKSVGIVGAGPSGLTCGYYLAKLGYDVDVYEAESVAGGMLALGIPEYRLPKDVLKYEIANIEKAGVKIHLNTKIGADISFDSLNEKHDALYIAAGTQLSRKMDVPGENLKGIYHGLDFLKDLNLGKDVKAGEKVAVIGGGNTAIDAARSVLRLGAKEVTILYRRGIEDMPADKKEIEDAIEEGINIIPYVAPIEFMGSDSVNGIKCIRMGLGEFDSTGRRKPVPLKGTEFTIEIDMAIPAVSQYADLSFVENEKIELTKWGTFMVDKDTLMTTEKGIFAGGDAARGPDTVITAIADGKKAAKSIDIYLGGKGVFDTEKDIEIPKTFDEDEVQEHERFPVNYLDPEERKKTFDEVSLGYDKLSAIAEAMRCLRCDRRV